MAFGKLNQANGRKLNEELSEATTLITPKQAIIPDGPIFGSTALSPDLSAIASSFAKASEDRLVKGDGATTAQELSDAAFSAGLERKHEALPDVDVNRAALHRIPTLKGFQSLESEPRVSRTESRATGAPVLPVRPQNVSGKSVVDRLVAWLAKLLKSLHDGLARSLGGESTLQNPRQKAAHKLANNPEQSKIELKKKKRRLFKKPN